MSVNSNWCRWPDSNRHARKEQQILSLWCLPIPPQRQIKRLQLGLPFLPTHTAFNWYPSVRSFVHPSLAWQGIQGSNLYRNSQSVMCYHYTNPLYVIWTKWKLQDTFWTIDLPVGRFAKYSQNRARTYNILFEKQNLLYVSLERFMKKLWCGMTDSNRRPPECKSDALPAAPIPHLLDPWL